MGSLPSRSVHLVVTSPPYPMIEMWDAVFAAQDATIGAALGKNDGWSAFRTMHAVLDRVWTEVHRVLVDGGIACINIGDATRTIRDDFALYPNHARVLTALLKLGFTPLPAILWRKQTNAPNKFMGSGMLPTGAYVTLEHEYVLIVRKGSRREFLSGQAKSRRRGSSFFWEERNTWYSDVWFDLKGATQKLSRRNARDRSGAFPLELPYRLISMFSVKGETVLDPFAGTGTTTLAAAATARNSVGYEIDPNLAALVGDGMKSIVRVANARIDERLETHAAFVTDRFEAKGRFGYRNAHYGFPVVTRQEVELLLDRLVGVDVDVEDAVSFRCRYSGKPQAEHVRDWTWFFEENGGRSRKRSADTPRKRRGEEMVQLDLLGSIDR